jgi:hypothetical protein
MGEYILRDKEEFRQCNLRLPFDLKVRFVAQLKRIATLNDLSFPEEINSKGEHTSHTIECLTGLLEDTLDTDLESKR